MVKRKKPPARTRRGARDEETKTVAGLRIIGGHFRGRKLQYSGDPRTRPMKDRVREALFNLLGHGVKGKLAIDLFAGTGALAFEALSRGAARAVAIEMHRPTVQLILQNAETLQVESRLNIVTSDTFHWARQFPEMGLEPWVVFCSPPYDFYTERKGEMLELLNSLADTAPPESLFAVEADDRFDFGALWDPGAWDIRRYPPAIVGIWEKGAV